jgi:hypothetical protein
MSHKFLLRCMVVPACLFWGLRELIALQRVRLQRPRRSV